MTSKSGWEHRNIHSGAPVKNAKNRPKQASKKRRSAKLPVCFTIQEKERFFSVIKSTRDRALFGLLYFHGLRASEPGKLKYSDYRPGSTVGLDKLLFTRLKNGVSGECALVPAAAQMLRAWLRQRGHEEGPIFISRQKSPLSRSRVFRLMWKYCEAAGIPPEKRHPHALRHSCAVHLLSDRREGVIDVQRHLGHRNVKSTMVYLGALTDEFNDARIRRLSNWK